MNKPLNHSIENIYAQVGQYDRYAIFDFYFKSEAYLKYGGSVHGLIIYTPSERLKLEEAIMPGNNSNHDGTVRVDANNGDLFYHELKTVGFNASDVVRLSALDSGPVSKKYRADGIKEITNTINVSIPFSTDGPFALELYVLKKRISEGLPLLPFEERKYVGLDYIVNPSPETSAKFNELLSRGSEHSDDAAIAVYSYNYSIEKNNATVKQLLGAALKRRRIKRINFISRHLGISSKVLDAFKLKDEKSWAELMSVILGFEPTPIQIWGWQHPVWWDFERFAHIYLRHYKNFFLEESSKGQGTNFQYHFKDIRRLIGIVIDRHKDEIEASLSQNKPYNRYDDQGYYYNGDFYTFRIASDGKLMQFHPQE